MKITYSWRNFPTCPEATKYDQERSRIASLLQTVCGFFQILFVILFFAAMSDFLNDYNWGLYFVGLGCLIVGGILTHLMYVVYPNSTERDIQLILIEHQGLPEDFTHELQEQIRANEHEALKRSTISFYFYFTSAILVVAMLCILIYAIIESAIGFIILSAFSIVGLIFGVIYLRKKLIKYKQTSEEQID